MAEPRVFLSSTFYDLRHVRSDLDAFVRELGYVPIRNESGDIPYGRDEQLEEYCYREIERCDIMVSIIGGRFGHSSRRDEECSISQVELRTALRLRKQVYIFIEKNVLYEFETYGSWPEKERGNFHPYHANDIRIHEFILEVKGLPNNNPIFPFESSHEITTICRRQWAGSFQGLLQQQAKRPEEDLISQLKDTLSITRQLVDYLAEEKKRGSGAVENILLSNHPVFQQLQRECGISFRVFFTNVEELSALLVDRGYREVPEIEWQSPEYMEWIRSTANEQPILKIKRAIFDSDHRLVVFSPYEWKQEFLQVEKRNQPARTH